VTTNRPAGVKTKQPAGSSGTGETARSGRVLEHAARPQRRTRWAFSPRTPATTSRWRTTTPRPCASWRTPRKPDPPSGCGSARPGRTGPHPGQLLRRRNTSAGEPIQLRTAAGRLPQRDRRGPGRSRRDPRPSTPLRRRRTNLPSIPCHLAATLRERPLRGRRQCRRGTAIGPRNRVECRCCDLVPVSHRPGIRRPRAMGVLRPMH
jgi:hypothetical protein